MHKCEGCGTETVHADDCPALDPPDGKLPCLRTIPHPPHNYMFNRTVRRCPGVQGATSDLYFCPTVGEIESDRHGGFRGGTCCAHPELHVYVGKRTAAIDAISTFLSNKAREEYANLPVHPGQEDPTTIKWVSGPEEAKDELLRLQKVARYYRDRTCPGEETDPNICQCGCEGCTHNCAAHQEPEPLADNVLEHVTRAVARYDMDHMMSPEQPLPDADHDFWRLWRSSARNAITAYNSYMEQHGQHRYLSTGCLHGEHGYCQSNTGSQGQKIPAQCKFCQAPCVCSCHLPGEVTEAVSGQTAIDDLVTGTDDDMCGAEPPQRADDPDSPWGDCWCTKPGDHEGDHACEPCTKRHGAPSWPQEPDDRIHRSLPPQVQREIVERLKARQEPTVCPSECDDDCEAPCHEEHAVPWKRHHDPQDCPSRQGEPEDSDDENLREHNEYTARAYAKAVGAPLSLESIAALSRRIREGKMPRRKISRSVVVCDHDAERHGPEMGCVECPCTSTTGHEEAN